MTDPFGEYHRRTFLDRAAQATAVVMAVAALVAGIGALAAGAPPRASPLGVVSPVAAPLDPPATPPVLTPVALPEPQPDPVAPPDASAEPLSSTGPREWTIVIDTTGYQPEIDACLWVRMDLRAAAPIVGAHNNCGGEIVLEMALGDTVLLSGAALDGRYTVMTSRDAHAGDNAAVATSGMEAEVILQTCYQVNDGSERLVGLTRA